MAENKVDYREKGEMKRKKAEAFMPEIWINRRYNRFYTGNAALLETLDGLLKAHQVIAVSGLGGIGKTDFLLRYISEYGQGYNAAIWIDATSPESVLREIRLIGSTLTMALLKGSAVLVVLDNVQDVNIREYFFSNIVGSKWKGNLILVTRFQTSFPSLALSSLSIEEGALLLLRCGKRVSVQGDLDEASEKNRTSALEIAEAMGGFPLALSQAGSYIEETGRGPDHYLSLFKEHSLHLLSRRGRNNYHPASFVEVMKETIQSLSPVGQQVMCDLVSLPSDSLAWQQIDPSVREELLRVYLVEDEHGEIKMHRLVRAVLAQKSDSGEA